MLERVNAVLMTSKVRIESWFIFNQNILTAHDLVGGQMCRYQRVGFTKRLPWDSDFSENATDNWLRIFSSSPMSSRGRCLYG
ncbi:hypothetical protein [Mastigocoleus testarum]|uniref:hypothetical protein n=1 Tax=Mastigocoleus testarum TaxID=996925 RepID=UPI00128ED1FF|nr:hypothetical protein [Mastigocoleus testarum]